MDQKLVVLKLFVDQLEIPFDISTVDSRLIVQKAIYLGQLSGVDLGYRYGWYIHGPYSSELTKDYYALDRAIRAGNNDTENRHFNDNVQSLLNSIKELICMRDSTPLTNWMELLASYHYLRTVQNKNHEDAVSVIEKKKPHLMGDISRGKLALESVGLLPA